MAESWPWFKWNWMGRSNDSLHLWIDCKIGRYWYVLVWRKERRPYCYRSLDATPCGDSVRVFFGDPHRD